jgi:hypothetical protein
MCLGFVAEDTSFSVFGLLMSPAFRAGYIIFSPLAFDVPRFPSGAHHFFSFGF